MAYVNLTPDQLRDYMKGQTIHDFEPGEIVAYLPSHAEYNICHEQVEYGIVKATNSYGVRVTYFKDALCNGVKAATSKLTYPSNLLKIH